MDVKNAKTTWCKPGFEV